MSDRDVVSPGLFAAAAITIALIGTASLGQPTHNTRGLQGIWVSNSATPLERPNALEGRAHLTQKEVAELKQRADRIFKEQNSDYSGGDAVFLAALGDVDRYKSPNATAGSADMIEREFDDRTSLIVDPPDGKVPAQTPAGQQRALLRRRGFVSIPPIPKTSATIAAA